MSETRHPKHREACEGHLPGGGWACWSDVSRMPCSPCSSSTFPALITVLFLWRPSSPQGNTCQPVCLYFLLWYMLEVAYEWLQREAQYSTSGSSWLWKQFQQSTQGKPELSLGRWHSKSLSKFLVTVRCLFRGWVHFMCCVLLNPAPIQVVETIS